MITIVVLITLGGGGPANDYVIILVVIILAPQGKIFEILCCKSIDFLKKIAFTTQKALKNFRLRRGYFSVYLKTTIFMISAPQARKKLVLK